MSWQSYKSSWQIQYRLLRFSPGQSESILIVGEPWTFKVQRRDEQHLATRHLCDVLVQGEKALRVFEINNDLFNRIRALGQDPNRVWLKVTRFGRGRDDTTWKLETISQATQQDLDFAASLARTDLNAVAKLRQHHYGAQTQAA